MTTTPGELLALENETVFQNVLCQRVDAWRALPEYAEITLVDWLLESGIVVRLAAKPADEGVRIVWVSKDHKNRLDFNRVYEREPSAEIKRGYEQSRWKIVAIEVREAPSSTTGEPKRDKSHLPFWGTSEPMTDQSKPEQDGDGLQKYRLLVDRLRWIYKQDCISLPLLGEMLGKLPEIISGLDTLVTAPSSNGAEGDNWHADFQARCRALGTAPPPDGAGEILPCDVHLPPNTYLRKGCPLNTLMTALRARETFPPEAESFLVETTCGDDTCAACGATRREHTTPGGTRYGEQSLCGAFIPQDLSPATGAAEPVATPQQVKEACAQVADRAAESDGLWAAQNPDQAAKFEQRAQRARTIATSIRALIPAVPLVRGGREAIAKLREIVDLDSHGRYGRLAREAIALLLPVQPGAGERTPEQEEISKCWQRLEESGFPPEASGWPFKSIVGALPDAIDAALDCLIRQREDLLKEVQQLRQPQPSSEGGERLPKGNADV